MIEITTRWIVAIMKNHKAIWDSPIFKFPNYPMGRLEPAFIIDPKFTISIWRSISPPFPAIFWIANIDFRPKSTSQRTMFPIRVVAFKRFFATRADFCRMIFSHFTTSNSAVVRGGDIYSVSAPILFEYNKMSRKFSEALKVRERP